MPLTAGVYRPRHPERTVVYWLFEEHHERYVRESEEGYEAREASRKQRETDHRRVRTSRAAISDELGQGCRPIHPGGSSRPSRDGPTVGLRL